MTGRPILYKFKIGQRVTFDDGRHKGIVRSRVPCEPKPMYYVNAGDTTALLHEQSLTRAPPLKLRYR